MIFKKSIWIRTNAKIGIKCILGIYYILIQQSIVDSYFIKSIEHCIEQNLSDKEEKGTNYTYYSNNLVDRRL